MTLTLVLEEHGELGQRGSFTRTLKADHHQFDRRLDLKVEFAGAPAHHFAKFVGNELQQVLFGRERTQHFLAQRLLADVVDEIAHHPDIYISLEQGQPYFAQRGLLVALGDAALASELFKNAFESIAQSVEHDLELTMVSKS